MVHLQSPFLQTTGNGTGATIKVTMIAFFGAPGPTNYTAVSCELVDIGLDYNAGEFMTITPADLQSAGFPSIFDKNLVVEIRDSNQSSTGNTGYWDMDVTPISTAFSSGNYISSSFTELIPRYTGFTGVPTELYNSTLTASYTAKFENK